MKIYDPKRGVYIPQAIARYGAASDAYLRKLTGKCGCCGAKFVLDSSESGEVCQSCYDIGGIENEISDGHITREAGEAEIRPLLEAIRAAGGNPDEAYTF